MNLALPALLIILFILPGILSRYAYTRGILHRWSNIVQVRPWTDEIIPSLTLAILLQTLWYALVYYIIEPLAQPVYNLLKPDFFSAFVLLTGSYGPNDQFYERALRSVTNYPFQIAFYLLGLFLFALSVGWFFRYVVIKLRLDLKYEWMRFSNIWHYLLTGEVLNFENDRWKLTGFGEDRSPISGVFLAAVVEQGAENYLYRGIVKDFWFDPRSGDLEGVQLMLADRRSLAADTSDTSTPERDSETEKRNLSADTLVPKKDSERYHRIRGDFFVLKYPETSNINLLYFGLEKKNGDQPSPKSDREIYRGTVKPNTREVLATAENRNEFRDLLDTLINSMAREICGKIGGENYILTLEYESEISKRE